jgi:hypothetical protein
MLALSLTSPLVGLALMLVMQRIEEHIVPSERR